MIDWLSDVDWSAVLASGLVSVVVSALVGGLVSIATIHQLTVRRVRAERVEDARRELAQVAGDRRRKLGRYVSGIAPGGQREDVEKNQMDDASTCLELVGPAMGVGRWRSKANRRRLVALFGRETMKAVDVYRDVARDRPGDWTMLVWLQSAIEHRPQLDSGKWDAAWCAEPGSWVGKRAVQRMKRLERSSLRPW